MSQVSDLCSTSVQFSHSTSATSSEPPALEQAVGLIRKGNYRAAAEVLERSPRSNENRNLLGVCLLRSGQLEQSVHVFRQLVLLPGSVSERSEISDGCKRNFATALLLSGLPSGALDVLQSTREKQHPIEVGLRSCIARWENSLSFFRRLDWRINRIEPPKCEVPIDFEPGEFHLQVESTRPDNPPNNSVTIAA